MEEIIEKLPILKAKMQLEIDRARKRRATHIVQLEKSQDWEIYKNFADTILINKNAIKKGTDCAELTDALGNPLKITLNTAIGAVDNAEMYYKKARKGKRGCEICAENIKTEDAKIAELQKNLAVIEDFLQNGFLGRENEIQNFIDKYLSSSAQKIKTNEEAPKTPFRRYVYKGYEIFAGKTSADNDELSIKFAKPSDIWFHAVGYAGSHLIIRRPKNAPMPPDEILRIAGGIAVFFSKAKNCGYVEVHIAEARYVRKPRKSPPGLVVVERYKTMRVSPVDPQILFKEMKNEN
ncbi:MAG: NFACT RNA binding domain-containing protein [Chitinivibrionia bacterium]|nr:NFACT RNA binding domain-containing protein [Chitinivibrionia bacterium]